jgi:hypothetical protein
LGVRHDGFEGAAIPEIARPVKIRSGVSSRKGN